MSLDPTALAKAREAYIRSVKAGGDPSAVTQAVVEAYLASVKPKAPRSLADDGRVSPITRRCAALRPGQFIDVEPQPLQSIRGRFVTARKLMKNPAARFQTESLLNGKVRIRRLPDGSRYWRDPWKNAKAVELASLKPGQSVIARTLASTRSAGAMGSNTKIAARKILGNPRADWSVRMTTQGVELTRLADRESALTQAA